METTREIRYGKVFDMIAAIIVFSGSIHLGLLGLFGVNVIEGLFGSMSLVTRLIYLLVGVAALYEAVMWNTIQRRWECSGSFGRTQTRPV
jgi:uncharacterized protein